MAARALDIECRQCLVDFFEDPNLLRWHHRLLLIPSNKDEGKWICATPDYDVQVIDLSQHRVLPLRRGQLLPPERVNETYAFDELEPGDFDDLMRQARELAVILGYEKPTQPDVHGIWRVADTAAVDLFAKEVPADAMADDELVVIKGTKGLAMIDEEWHFIERVLKEELEEWTVTRLSTGQLDPRILPLERDDHKRRFRSEHEALRVWKSKKEDDFPFRGPKALKEWFEALEAAGQTLVQHHFDFIKRSGIAERGAVAREHANLSEAMRYFVAHDQVDPTMLSGCELLVRRLIMIETAVSRSPKAPDWDGLDHIVSSRITDSGAAVAQGFNSWLSTVQRDDAQILKQGRLLREERLAEAKRKGDKGGGGGGGKASAAADSG